MSRGGAQLPSLSAPLKWRIASAGRVYDPGESTVVYFDTESGDTHLLSDFAAFIIEQFGTQCLSADELLNRVSPEVEPGQFPDLAAAVQDVVRELAALDILKRA